VLAGRVAARPHPGATGQSHARRGQAAPDRAHGTSRRLSAQAPGTAHLRVSPPRRHQRFAGRGQGACPPAFRGEGEGQPYCLQCLAGPAFRPAAARTGGGVSGAAQGQGAHRDAAQKQGSGHRRRLRPAARGVPAGGRRLKFRPTVSTCHFFDIWLRVKTFAPKRRAG